MSFSNPQTMLNHNQNLFLFCLFGEVGKVFDWKVWRAQEIELAHLHTSSAARALASLSRCFYMQ